MFLRRPLPTAALCGLLAAGALIAPVTVADGHRAREREPRPAQAVGERALSLDEAVARAERRYRARAVRAEEKRRGDRIEYRIRLLGEDGRVFEIRVDAATGREA